MPLARTVFKCSSPEWRLCPTDGKPELALIGRSNVGKSSLLNALTGIAGLAKVSGTPGKTRLINHFSVDDRWYLVDLPGYGFAKTSKDERKTLDYMIRSYIAHRQQLYSVFLLVDCRHDPLPNDLDFLRWLGENGVPLAIVFTKADKLSREALGKQLDKYKAKLLDDWEELPPTFVTSAEKGTGVEELAGYMESICGANGADDSAPL